MARPPIELVEASAKLLLHGTESLIRYMYPSLSDAEIVTSAKFKNRNCCFSYNSSLRKLLLQTHSITEVTVVAPRLL